MDARGNDTLESERELIILYNYLMAIVQICQCGHCQQRTAVIINKCI